MADLDLADVAGLVGCRPRRRQVVRIARLDAGQADQFGQLPVRIDLPAAAAAEFLELDRQHGLRTVFAERGWLLEPAFVDRRERIGQRLVVPDRRQLEFALGGRWDRQRRRLVGLRAAVTFWGSASRHQIGDRVARRGERARLSYCPRHPDQRLGID